MESVGSFFRQLGMYDVDAGDGDLAVEMPVTPQVCNMRGTLQGGLIATLADVVGGRAALDASAPGDGGVATSDMSLHYLSPITVGPARATARILRCGRRSIVVQVTVSDVGRGRPAVIAMMTFAVLRAPQKPTPVPPQCTGQI